jgi:hypothetical protein
MQKPTVPTRSPSVASWASRNSIAPRKSFSVRSMSKAIISLPASSGEVVCSP